MRIHSGFQWHQHFLKMIFMNLDLMTVSPYSDVIFVIKFPSYVTDYRKFLPVEVHTFANNDTSQISHPLLKETWHICVKIKVTWFQYMWHYNSYLKIVLYCIINACNILLSFTNMSSCNYLISIAYIPYPHQMTPLSSSGWFENNCTRQLSTSSSSLTFNTKTSDTNHHCQATRCADGHLGTLQLRFKPCLWSAHGRDVSPTGCISIGCHHYHRHHDDY